MERLGQNLMGWPVRLVHNSLSTGVDEIRAHALGDMSLILNLSVHPKVAPMDHKCCHPVFPVN